MDGCSDPDQSQDFLELYIDYESGRQIYGAYGAGEIPEVWEEVREEFLSFLNGYLEECAIAHSDEEMEALAYADAYEVLDAFLNAVFTPEEAAHREIAAYASAETAASLIGSQWLRQFDEDYAGWRFSQAEPLEGEELPLVLITMEKGGKQKQFPVRLTIEEVDGVWKVTAFRAD